MSVTAIIGFGLAVSETLELSLDCSDDPVIEENLNTPTILLTATSSPPAKNNFCDDRQLAAGTDSIDLTVLARSGLANVDMTGQRIQEIKVEVDAANSAFITVKADAVNGYEPFGAGNELDLPAGSISSIFLNNGSPLIDASTKVITVESTDVDAKYKIHLVSG